MNLAALSILLIVAVSVLGIRISKKPRTVGEALSPESSGMLRGVLCLLIVMHHLSLACDATGVLGAFKHIGYLAVGAFFFLSGYGLAKQYSVKGDAYMKGFLPKRAGKLLPPLLLCALIYFAVFSIFGTTTIQSVLMSFVNVDPFPYHSWYVWASMLLYIVFYIAFRFIRSFGGRMALLLSSAAVLCVVLSYFGKINNLAASAFCFPVGVLFAMKGEIAQKLSRFWMIPVSAVVLGASVVGAFILPDGRLWLIAVNMVHNISVIAFCLLVVALTKYVKIGNICLKFIGKYSFEIYITHALVYKLLLKIEFFNRIPLVYIVVSLVLSVFLGFLFAKLYGLLRTACLRIFKKSA